MQTTKNTASLRSQHSAAPLDLGGYRFRIDRTRAAG
jgi:hypothetical protein